MSGFRVGLDGTPLEGLEEIDHGSAASSAYAWVAARPELPNLTIIKVYHPNWILGPLVWRAKLVRTKSRLGNPYIQLRFFNRGVGQEP